MEEYFTLVWDWLGDEDHRARLLAIIAALGLIGGFLGWVFGLFKRSSGGNQRASGGSVNVGGDVGGDVVTGGKPGGENDPS